MNIKNYKIKRLNYCKICEYDCESVCPVYKVTKNNKLTPKNKAIKALNSIKEWNFSDNIDFYACINCNNCKNYCPHKNNVSEVLEYVKEKTIISENTSSKILKFEEDFYKKLGNIKFIPKNNKILVKNLPSFLAFYNLGFRDETVTELKTFFKSIKHKNIIIEDLSFIYIVNKLSFFLKAIKIPIMSFNTPKKEDYVSIVTSGLEISNPTLSKQLIKGFKK